ncbi:hypothetical protein BDW59DRAFT_172853 [Aspergillus cavernicola]|uniref:RNA polymerase Rpb1 C-terminal repeat domain-containing protein n=1 Tax=Aspergillus cavernicola TaxID=176166 RepID=A0ABR4I9T6_9EURO
MAKPGKKSKSKADSGKQKNKKGKSQEGSEIPTPQPELSSRPTDEQQLAEATPLPVDSVSDLTVVPTSELELQPVPEVAPEPALEPTPEPAPDLPTELVPELEPAPEKQPGSEQPKPVEGTPTPFDFEIPTQSPFEDDGFTQIIKPGTPSSQQPGMNDAHVQEPSQEELGAWEQLDTAEVKNEYDDARTQQNNSVESSQKTPVTAPQSPTFTLRPETVTEATGPWPAWEETDQPKASATQEKSIIPESHADIPAAFTNPFAEPTPAEPVSAPVSEAAPVPEVDTVLEVAVAAPLPEFGPEPELDPVPEPQPITELEPAEEPATEPERVAEPEPTMAPEPVMEPEHAIEPAQEVTPPASKPQSPAPETASPSYKSASPMQRAISPATISVADTIDGPHGFSSIPPPAAPTPPAASPRTIHASPVKDAVYPVPRAAPPTPPSASPLYYPSYPPTDQGYSPRQKSMSPMHRHASPVRKPSSPLPKVSSPLANTYTSPVMSPHNGSLPPMPPSVPPSVSHSYATAYQSPVMSSGGYFPPHYGYYQPTSHPHPMHRGSMPPNGGGPFQGMRDQIYSNEHPHPGRGGPIAPPTDQEDARELLERIQEAIPDINRLLGTFKHTKTKLQSREAEFKQMESQHKQALMHKEFFIEALQNQLRKTANESAEEASKLKNMINELRMELGNMEEKRKDLEEKLTDSEASIDKLEQGKSELEDQIKKLNHDFGEERVAHGQELEKQRAEKVTEKEEALKTQKLDLTEFFEEIKAEDEKAAAEALAAREAELQEQQEVMKAEYEEQKQQMQESHNTLQAEFNSKLEELASTKDDLEQKHKELEDTRQAHAEQVESLENSHQQKVTEMETQLSEKSEELANSDRENKRLEEDVLSKEKQLEHSVEHMRLTITNLDKDCDRLKKTLHSLGEATDLKNTKGDTFFLDCFDQLQRLIVTLSKEHFSYLPIDPPQEVLSKLPPELPSFLDNTPASRELRSAYVQHVVSKTLTYRIFHPFLFTLGRRYDKADILFQMLSMDIRRKSVRREAFWRQQTLKAAYTTSDAKDSINVVAAVIVDEISNHLKHFADPRRMDSLLTGIRKIVKLAAETWRHARVERELIIASLESGSLSNEDWEEYGASGQGSSTKTDPTRHVILRPFPRIIREGAHEDFVGDEEKAHSCTYSRGAVLYSDSPIVLARLQELAKKSTDALAGEDSPRARRYSRASNYSEPPSPLHSETTYVAHDAFIDGATGVNFGTA